MHKFWEVYFAPEDGGAASALTTPPAATPPASGAPSGSGDPGVGGTSPWYQTAIPAEHHKAITEKGWDKLGQEDFAKTVFGAHAGLEKLLGRTRLAVPRDATDVEAIGALQKTLGWPATAKDYKIEGLSEAYTKALSPEIREAYLDAMHKAGVTQKQAETLFKLNEAQFTKVQESAAAEQAKALETQQNALAIEWGAATEANKKMAAATMRAFGLDEPTLTKIETVLGYDGLYKLMHSIGAKTMEDGFAGIGTSSAGFGGTPQAANAEIQKLINDREFQTKLQHRDPRIRKDALEKWEGLHKQAAG